MIPREFKFTAVRECPMPGYAVVFGTHGMAEKVLAYWNRHIATAPGYDPDLEQGAMLLLDAEKNFLGHLVFAQGQRGSVLMEAWHYAQEVRAIGTKYVILAHNHPGGDATPSDADVLHVRSAVWQMEAADMELLDSIVIGDGQACSLAMMGVLEEVETITRDSDERPELKDARDRWRFTHFLLGGDRALQDVLFDAAEAAGVDQVQYVVEAAREYLRAVKGAGPGTDPQLSFCAQVTVGPRERDMLVLLIRAAMRKGKGVEAKALAWQRGVELLRNALLAELEEQEAAAARASEATALAAEGTG